METKFKVGDKVTVVYNSNKDLIGKTGTVVNVIPRNEGKTTGLYKIKCDVGTIPDYATDDCLE